MKYLKTYESLSSEEDIKQTITDICLELLDENYIRLAFGERNRYAFLRTKDPEKWLNWEDLKDTCLRIKDYLGDSFIQFKWREHPITRKDSDNLYNYTNLTERTNIDKPIWSVAIEYDISERIQESKDEVTEVLKDIFLEVKDIDNRFNIKILSKFDYDEYDISETTINEDYIDVYIERFSELIDNRGWGRFSFYITDIEETIHRMIYYMSSLGYNKYTIFSKERKLDSPKELVILEGDYIRYKIGPYEYRYNKPISFLQIKFRKE
jgi:hypothetical protein